MNTFPELSTTTHSDSEGQETPESCCAPGSVISLHVFLARVGSVEVAIFWAPTATHNDLVAHDRSVNKEGTYPGGGSGLGGGIGETLHALAPPVGLVELSDTPEPAITQKCVVTQEMGLGTSPDSVAMSAGGFVNVHSPVPAVGAVAVRMSPCRSSATHSDTAGQETSPKSTPVDHG